MFFYFILMHPLNCSRDWSEALMRWSFALKYRACCDMLSPWQSHCWGEMPAGPDGLLWALCHWVMAGAWHQSHGHWQGDIPEPDTTIFTIWIPRILRQHRFLYLPKLGFNCKNFKLFSFKVFLTIHKSYICPRLAQTANTCCTGQALIKECPEDGAKEKQKFPIL